MSKISPTPLLSPRERQVVTLLSQGASREEIRLRLGADCSSAVSQALQRARGKTGAVTNEHLIALLYRAGVLR